MVRALNQRAAHSLALKGGKVVAWGLNDWNQAGAGPGYQFSAKDVRCLRVRAE